MKKIILGVDGMTCSACSNGLEKYLNKQDGIKNASVNLIMANVLVEYDEKILNQSKIEIFIKKAGFKSTGVYKEISSSTSKKSKQNLIIFSVLAILMLYISMGHMINTPILNFLYIHEKPVYYASALLIIAIPFVIYGFDIIKNGYRNLINKMPNMDTLVAVGVTSSLVYSFYSFYKIILGDASYTSKLYFESAAIVIYFIKLGRYIDKITKNKTREAVQDLVQITPKDALVKSDNGEEKVITIDEVKKDNILICKPGMKFAVDGEIVLGKTHVDESFMTGESKPVLKDAGSKVIAGSINYDGYVEYKAEKIGNESTISEIIKLVLNATSTKTKIEKLADKVSGVFVPLVIAIAVLTFISYILLGYEFNEAIGTFITILVVACPCSLGLATPLAIVVSEGKCAKNGIFVKKSEVLETAAKVDAVVLDKTGTITYGNLRIAKINNYSNISIDDLLSEVGSIENKSMHPISKAFTNYLKENKLNLKEVLNFEDIPGLGITASIDEKEFLLGNKKILEKYNIKNEHENDENKLVEDGCSIVYVVQNKNIVALIGVNDVVRKNAKEVINNLSDKKIDSIMLTGDNETTAKKIADEIGISKVVANVSPNDKLKYIENIKNEKKMVMMCGDGINDSPALAVANIGVSLNSGTDVAMDSSDVILLSNDLNGINKLIEISKKTLKIIKQNLFWSFFYNVLMIPIAMGLLKSFGISINPMIASFAMMLSSLTVVFNALRLR